VNKQELVEEMSERCDFSKAAANRAVDSILDSIANGLRTGDEISFPGFGKFLTQKRKARDAQDPRDRSRTVHISAATVPKFRAGTNLRAAVESVEPIQRARPRAASSGTSKAASAGWKPLAQRA
jgi:DNA-binding protein HU-beta